MYKVIIKKVKLKNLYEFIVCYRHKQIDKIGYYRVKRVKDRPSLVYIDTYKYNYWLNRGCFFGKNVLSKIWF